MKSQLLVFVEINMYRDAEDHLLKILVELVRQYLQGGYIQQARDTVDQIQEIVGKPDVP